MPMITIRFHRCAANADGRPSRVFFALEVDGKASGEYHADVEHVAAGPTAGEMAVGPPIGYSGPFDQRQFSEHVRAYVRQAVSSQGKPSDAGPGETIVSLSTEKGAMAPTSSFKPDPFW
jgi:hypothetical protein